MENTSFLATHFPNHVWSEVVVGTIVKHVIYSDNTSHAMILGMAVTKPETLANAEKNAKSIVLRDV